MRGLRGGRRKSPEKGNQSCRSQPSAKRRPACTKCCARQGKPLDNATRAYFEPRFGQDFSRVRVHAGAQAAKSAGAVNACAYTVGQSLVFGSGKYMPRTAEGRRLLAHELTHTLQQGPKVGMRLQREPGSGGTPNPPTASSGAPNFEARLRQIIKTGGPLARERGVLGAFIVEGPGYTSSHKEFRTINSIRSNERLVTEDASVFHAPLPESNRQLNNLRIFDLHTHREPFRSRLNDAERIGFEYIAANLTTGNEEVTVHFPTMAYDNGKLEKYCRMRNLQ